ncbi:tetratricopeptide repeat protein [Desulfonema magnum]|uniref:Tetratricopeptide repeat-containing n=1 Tax=Desulfonema magnum TaxID=45655 RepID=A0A975BII0_9BACT|nr:tetratricopeptide repeat protein [Desulfonema magnum]QTA85958.1 tetratricopeptide repeat-containing [Desulfonema magnum]
MGKQRYYLTENDHSYLIRVFPNAKKLSWFQVEENGSELYCHIDIDFENISKTDKEILGKDCDSCLEKLKQYVQSAPPGSVSPSPKILPSESAIFGVVKKKKKKSIRLIFGIAFICALVIAVGKYHIDVKSKNESPGASSEKKINFMQLLRKSLKTTSDDEETASRISDMLSQCQQHLKANRLTTGNGGTALECYRSVLTHDPNNTEAMAGLQKIEMKYILWAKDAFRNKNFKKVREYLAGLDRVNPDSSGLAELRQEIAKLEKQNQPETHTEIQEPVQTHIAETESVSTTAETETDKTQIAALLSECQNHLKAKRLTSGKSGTALECYQEVLRDDPDNTEALAGLQNIEMQYVLWARKALRRKNMKKFRAYLASLEMVNPESSALAELRKEIAAPKKERPVKSSPQPVKADTRLPASGSSKNKKTEDLTEMSLGVEFNR